MKDRIIKFLTQESLSATKFADEIGVQRSSISHILSGRNNPSFEFIQKILSRYRNLNAEWLIIGSGPMYKKEEQQTSVSPPITPQSSKPVQQLNIFQNPTEKQTSADQPKAEKILSVPEIIPSNPSRNVEKILVFYSDKTFDEFSPSK